MRSVGLKVLKNKLSEYIRLAAAGETVLVNGATAVLNGKNGASDPWRARLLNSKPRKLAAVAVANKMARIVWAVMVRGEAYRPPAVAVASAG